MCKQLSYPAPFKEWVRGTNNMWYTRPWTSQGVLECLSGGGWFYPGISVFATIEAAKLASDSMKIPKEEKKQKTILSSDIPDVITNDRFAVFDAQLEALFQECQNV